MRLARLIPALPLLALAACAAGPPGTYAAHGGDGRPLNRPVMEAWFDLRDSFRVLRIPIGSTDRETWTLESADLNLGTDWERYVACRDDLDRRRPLGSDPVARLRATLTPENGTTRVDLRLSAWVADTGPDGRMRQRECGTLGSFEEEVYRELRRRGP